MSTWKEKEDEARRQHILLVAEKLFAEKGLNETSIADIAREAEFGVGTLYKYFLDRNTLVESLLADRLNAHFAELEVAMNGDGTPPELIERLVDAYLRSVHSRSQFFRMYFTHFHPGHQPCRPDASAENDTISSEKAMFSRLDEIFQDGITQGFFVNPGQTDYLSAALFGMLMSFYFLCEFRYDGHMDVSGYKSAILRIFFENTLIQKKVEVAL